MDGNLYRLWFFTFAEAFNNAPKGNAYLGSCTLLAPLNRHMELISNVAFNRMIRFWERVRYKWRRRKTLVRFVVLRLDDIWSHWVPIEAQETKSAKVLHRRKKQAPTGQGSRQVA